MKQLEKKISIIIPTKNRHAFLVRQLSYYASLGFQGEIIVLDASDEDDFQKNKQFIAFINTKLNVSLHLSREGYNYHSIQKFNDLIKSQYVAFCGDDDFLVPNGLIACSDFLDKHPDYNSAHGTAMLFTVINEEGGANISTGPYSINAYQGKNGADRLFGFFSNYTVIMFALHRLDSWQAMFAHKADIPNPTLLTEILPCAISVINGKSKRLPELFLVRQCHDNRFARPDIFEQITAADWPESYKLLSEYLAKELSSIDNIAETEMMKIVKKSFWQYLIRVLSSNFQYQYVQQPHKAFVGGWQSIKKKWLFSNPLYAKARGIKYSLFKRRDLNVNALLNPHSEFYRDFIEVYQAIKSHSIKEG